LDKGIHHNSHGIDRQNRRGWGRKEGHGERENTAGRGAQKKNDKKLGKISPKLHSGGTWQKGEREKCIETEK